MINIFIGRLDGQDDTAKISIENEICSIIIYGGTIKDSNEQFYSHFTNGNTSADKSIISNFIKVLTYNIEKLKKDRGQACEFNRINIIIHWGMLSKTISRVATRKLRQEISDYYQNCRCEYNYHFYHFSTAIENKEYGAINKVMNFKNDWEKILEDKFSIEEVQNFPILNSLFILCQGYLVVYKSSRDYKRNEKVLEALQNMGWIDVEGKIKTDVTGFLPGSLGNKFVEVSNGSWWKKPFDDTSFDNGKFEKALIKECEGNNDLYNKVMEIFNNGDGIEPVVVAEVYLGLVKEWVQ